MVKAAIPKKPPTRIATDDYSVVVNGQTYYPHAGEWVEMARSMSVRGIRSLRKFQQLATEMSAAEGDANAGEEFMRFLDEEFEGLTEGLAERIRAWNWTNDFDEPLPPLDGTTAPFEALSADELFYLIGLANRRETAEQSKNGSGPMPTTGSDSQPTPLRTESSMGRSRMKAT